MSLAARLAAFDRSIRGAGTEAGRAGALPRGLVADAPPIEGAGFTIHDGGGRAENGRDPRAATVVGALERIAPERRSDVSPFFLDLETTGLGPAAVPFVVGLAGFTADGTAWVRQWLLAEPAGERMMWLSVLDALEARRGAVMITYNGASFDRTVVRLRLRRLGLWTDALAQAFGEHHLDLLPLCRRLWNTTLPDVRLLTLERRVLGSVRVGDPSGLEIAELGQRWVQGARDATTCAGVAAVRRHNADDLLGLASLVESCASAIASPTCVAQALGVARHLGRTQLDSATLGARTIALLEAWRREALRDAAMGVELLLALIGLLRRAGEVERAHAVLLEICTHHPGHRDAITRLAIDCEHRLRRVDLALAWLQTVEAPCPRRLARLLRKQGPAAGVGVQRSAPDSAPQDVAPVVPTSPAPSRVPGSWRAGAHGPARRAPPV